MEASIAALCPGHCGSPKITRAKDPKFVIIKIAKRNREGFAQSKFLLCQALSSIPMRSGHRPSIHPIHPSIHPSIQGSTDCIQPRPPLRTKCPPIALMTARHSAPTRSEMHSLPQSPLAVSWYVQSHKSASSTHVLRMMGTHTSASPSSRGSIAERPGRP